MRNLLLVVAMLGMAYLNPASAAPSAAPSAIRVAPAAAAAPLVVPQKTRPATASGGLVDCWKERSEHTRSCKRDCRTCDLWLLGLCLSSSVKEPCFGTCARDAALEYQECKNRNSVSP